MKIGTHQAIIAKKIANECVQRALCSIGHTSVDLVSILLDHVTVILLHALRHERAEGDAVTVSMQVK